MKLNWSIVVYGVEHLNTIGIEDIYHINTSINGSGDAIPHIPKIVYWNEEEDIFELIYVKLVIFVWDEIN